jgi:hypothetical protein
MILLRNAACFFKLLNIFNAIKFNNPQKILNFRFSPKKAGQIANFDVPAIAVA